MRKIERIIDGICNISGQFGAWLVPTMMALVLVEVVSRYVAHQPLLIADEFSAYMFVALSFLGLAYAWKEKAHVRIDALIDRLPPRVSQRVRVFSLLIALAFCLMINVESYGFIKTSFARHIRSMSWLSTPLQGPHLTITIGFAILTLWLMLETARAIKALNSNSEVESKAR